MIYRKISIEEATEQPVECVGVYVLRWDQHPEQPDYGFVPVDTELVMKQIIRALEERDLMEDLYAFKEDEIVLEIQREIVEIIEKGGGHE